MGWSHRWLYRGLYLTQSALDDVAAGLGIARIPYFTANAFTDADLIAAFRALHYALQDSADALRDRELLVGSFGALFRRHGSDGAQLVQQGRADRAVLGRVIELMQDRYTEALKLEELAAAAGLTQFQLIGLFNRLTGMSPHAYLTQVRLKSACRLLKRGALPADAASAAGFYDQSALNRHFKRAYGITPLQYASAA
jgi:AraC-like DNA-binding protein